jgi:hypothetical protein
MRNHFVYIYDNLREPERSCSVGSLRQLSELTGMSISTLKRKIRVNVVFYNEAGRYKVMKLVHKPDGRGKNGNLRNFVEKRGTNEY